MNYSIKLEGCAPVPLAYYLKALGVLRIVAEQFDSNARGCWQNDRFVLFTEKQLDEKGLINFFLHDYKPTPIVAPWNGGSGFYPKDNQDGIGPIENSNSSRFSEFKETIKLIKDVLNKYGYKNKPEDKVEKNKLLVILRNNLPEKILQWFDSAVVLIGGDVKYPPLLGTGGNDGRLDFTNNYMQRVVEMINPDDGKPTDISEKLLKVSIFAINESVKIEDAPVGQFFPAKAGGANQTRGFDSKSSVNPWDYILMLEGALFFASACVRRLKASATDAFSSPFCVETTAAGYASASTEDVSKSRGELWMPIWEKPSSIKELMYIFTEGRAQVGRRMVRNGLDFIRAAVTLGVDRGINAFQRYGIQERNGQANFAFA
ncbi:MAG TPA: type I-U CRISPR-associated protein Csx17, partial [Verrucomicrobiota bacterium]|nr:type I-U CRISPR-associated protein Csx17 [Verrucomicrobiota bacterium]